MGMEMVSFFMLCFLWGSAYAFVDHALNYFEPSVFTSLRMFFAFLASFVFLLFQAIRTSLPSFALKNIISSLVYGVIDFGLPSSLLTLAQKSVSSTEITIAQPVIPFFSLIFSHFLIKREVCSCKSLSPLIFALLGSIIAVIPSMSSSSKGLPLHYLFVLISVTLFGLGSVLAKKWIKSCDQYYVVMFKLLGGFIYSVIASLCDVGIHTYMAQIQLGTLIWPAFLGIFFSFLSSVLVLHVIQALGPVVAMYANYGQILVGVFIGVVFRDDWKSFTSSEILVSLFGLLVLFVSFVVSLIQSKNAKNDEHSPNHAHAE